LGVQLCVCVCVQLEGVGYGVWVWRTIPFDQKYRG
jgi:hypothetical protein